ncbi:MAG: tRNA epoxyqueuosine(34) reductase QueG [Candidatus Peregrinibacteria bacterium]|nr:tRNA epoxyqueuosine(34) reductase QueG [Candidatus Peregrinibacteria bacterium]
MQNSIQTLAKETGFDLVKFTSAQLNEPSFQAYSSWVLKGRAAEMAYMSRDLPRRRSVESLLPGAKSVVCLAVNYYRLQRESASPNQQGAVEPSGQVARYAYGRDYHKIIEKMLKRLVRTLREEYPQHEWKSYVDTGAVLERSYSEQAGLGYIGKNTNLITPELGSWVFLAEVLTTMELTGRSDGHETPTDSCGHCRLCLDICPTGALVGERELDARKCISYLTIENRGPIPIELRPLIGDWIYGCDLCQEICPKNVRAQAISVEELVAKRIGGDFQLLGDILQLRTDEQFNERFAGSAMRRAKREGLVRNACVVVANVKATSLVPLLNEVLENDASEMVREHAEWALNQFKNEES